MSFGLVEVITLLLGLSNFSLQANPRPPTPEAALQYAMPEADIVLHADLATFVPNNYKALMQLANQPQLKSSPELAQIVRKAVSEVDAMRGFASSMVGIDPTTDVSDATIFVQVAKPEPAFVAVVHGKFAVASLDKIAKITSSQTAKVGGGTLLEIAPNKPVLALTRDGVLLAGTQKLVRDRLADAWKPPARGPGTSLAHVAEMVAGKPVYGVAVALSPATRKLALEELGGPGGKKNFATDLIQRHKAMTFSIYHDGIGWTWLDRDRAGLDAMAQMSEGVLDLLRAAQVAPRGFAKIAIGALDSYRGTDKRVDELIRRKADILKIVESYTGDGQFKVKLDKNPAALRLDVRATGKSLSEVLPAGFIVPLAALGFLTGRPEMTPPPMSAPAPLPPPTGGKQPAPGTKQPAPGAKQPAPARPAPRPAPAARP